MPRVCTVAFTDVAWAVWPSVQKVHKWNALALCSLFTRNSKEQKCHKIKARLPLRVATSLL